MGEQVSERLVEQRIRNRIMEALDMLSDGEEHVQMVGFSDYFELFYDWIPHGEDGGFPDLSTLTKAEQEALTEVRQVLDQACDNTPKDMPERAFIATGWPQRIQPIARRALDLMLERGRFDEKVEETEPSKAL
jgi:hypothetical protein